VKLLILCKAKLNEEEIKKIDEEIHNLEQLIKESDVLLAQLKVPF
jgi:hypothetical protein